jgi:uncharacterized protein YjbI with pentapeptide repeats
MANPEHVAKLKEGVKAWNKWRLKCPAMEINLYEADFFMANLSFMVNLSEANLGGANLTRTDLRRGNLTGADLTDANLTEVNLTRADLSEANLGGANLTGATLRGTELIRVNFSRADLTGANLRGADLTDANLIAVNLTRADLSEANLRGVDLQGAKLDETGFANVNLSNVRGLDNCTHIGPSIIDHRTLAQSGPLSLPFLRGCGLPDQFIEYIPSLFNQSIQFYSCFISYSTEDQAFAERIHADLQNKGVRCWFAPHHIRGGKKIHEQIDEAIRIYDRLLLILSEHSMKSRWVKTEIANARKKEMAHGRRVLFPIRLVDFGTIRPWNLFDADIGDNAAAEVREYFIPDFSRWKYHDSYQKAFERLLQDLKADEAKAQNA